MPIIIFHTLADSVTRFVGHWKLTNVCGIVLELFNSVMSSSADEKGGHSHCIMMTKIDGLLSCTHDKRCLKRFYCCCFFCFVFSLKKKKSFRLCCSNCMSAFFNTHCIHRSYIWLFYNLPKHILYHYP